MEIDRYVTMHPAVIGRQQVKDLPLSRAPISFLFFSYLFSLSLSSSSSLAAFFLASYHPVDFGLVGGGSDTSHIDSCAKVCREDEESLGVGASPGAILARD